MNFFKKTAVIMELNTIDDYAGETVEDSLDSALDQIEEKQYEAALRDRGCSDIYKIAVTFDEKRVSVKAK